jgi:putative nucleotidyltransferase with HDIG domain
MNIDAERVRKAARSSVPLTVKTYTLPNETELQLEEILEVFLLEMGQEKLKDSLFYCLRELAVNAKKANTKRVYFEELNYDINDEKQYQEGMENFKQTTLDNIQHYLKKQKDAGLYIKIIFHAKADKLHIYIINNSEMTRKEQMRVYDRIARSRAFNSMEEALATVLDDSEGAGLGIVILVLMLKKIGLDEDAFDIDTEDGETIARVTIPMSEVRLEQISEISAKLTEHIDSLPQFPENIAALQSEIKNPDVEMADIARKIATDPALTADLLKLVNSAAYMLPKRVDNIGEAVKLVGLRTLDSMLFSYGAQKTLGEGTEETKGLWMHSHRTAFYAFTIAKSLLKRKQILDDVYVGGILHDMGKIVFSSVHPDLISNIQNFTQQKGIPTHLFEDFSAGLNHAELGAMIAEKWNFPEVLTESIRFHHDPHGANQAHRQVVDTVYLANALANIDEKTHSYEQIDPVVVARFNIPSLEHLMRIHARLAQKFEEERTM